MSTRRLLNAAMVKQLGGLDAADVLDEKLARAGKLPRSAVLARQLAGMGNNLNQIARQVNAGGGSGIDRVQVRLRPAVLENGAGGDR